MALRTGFVKRSLSSHQSQRETSRAYGISRHGFMRPSYPDTHHIDDHYSRSLLSGSRIPVQQLRNFSRTVPAKRAIRKIANNVIQMPWTIQAPVEKREDKLAQQQAKHLTNALAKPNSEEHNTYSKLVRAIISEVLTLGFAAVERQPGDDSHPFWLWVANGESLRVNPDWVPGDDDTPRFFDCGLRPDFTMESRPIYEENLFLIQFDCNAHELIPPSPIETAYRMINAWLGLGEFQFGTTSNAVREYMLIVEDAMNQDEIYSMRQYWEAEVINQGRIPIVGGKVSVQKLGARTDEELYPKYNELLLKMIGLAFDLSMRSFNIEPAHDNRATAGIAADSDFQDAVLPMANSVRESLQVEVLDFYEDGFSLEYTDIEPRSEESEAKVAAMLYAGNIATLNEMRIRVGLDPVGPGGDALFSGANLKDLAKATEVLEKEKQQKAIDQQKISQTVKNAPGNQSQLQPQSNQESNFENVEIPDKVSKEDLKKIIKAFLRPDNTEHQLNEKVTINAASKVQTDRRQPLDVLLGIKR